MSKVTYIVATFALIGVLAFVGTYNSTTRSLAVTADSSVEDLWAHWKLQYGKLYGSEQEEAHKFQSFKANFDFVQAWNSMPAQSSSVGLNEFADLTTEEFSTLKKCLPYSAGYIKERIHESFGEEEEEASEEEEETEKEEEEETEKEEEEETEEEETEGEEEEEDSNPSSWDWRQQGAVTPVKNQGDCGGCWSFSTTGTLEGLNFIKNNNLLSFSEQQLIDCSGSYGNQGCNGGWPFEAMRYTAANGIELESTYPFTGQDGTCNYQKSSVKFQNSGYSNVTSGNEAALENAVHQQPTSVCIEADQSVFQLYTGGVITSKACGTKLDHAVMAVGYNDGGSTPYWIVKNSWGPSWGLSGYVYIQKTKLTKTPGICGIALNAAYPTA